MSKNFVFLKEIFNSLSANKNLKKFLLIGSVLSLVFITLATWVLISMFQFGIGQIDKLLIHTEIQKIENPIQILNRFNLEKCLGRLQSMTNSLSLLQKPLEENWKLLQSSCVINIEKSCSGEDCSKVEAQPSEKEPSGEWI